MVMATKVMRKRPSRTMLADSESRLAKRVSLGEPRTLSMSAQEWGTKLRARMPRIKAKTLFHRIFILFEFLVLGLWLGFRVWYL